MTKNLIKNIGKTFALSGLCLTIAGCAPDPTIRMKTEPDSMFSMQNDEKYEVKRVAVFKDNLAYQNRRGIYEITNKKTGKTYFGVSGIGITENANHSAGKSTAEDER